jgi:NifU-like protein involved in Fe-S cluster formation
MSRYNAQLQEYFFRSVRPGGAALSGAAGSLEEGVQVSITADLAGDKLENVGFRVFGCPHIIALAHKVAESLEGAQVVQLRDLPLDELAQEFSFPVEKTGKLLIMKDALAACFAMGEAGATGVATHQAAE